MEVTSAPAACPGPRPQWVPRGHAGVLKLNGLKRGKIMLSVLTEITGAKELWNQFPSQILFQPRQSQEQACADSALAALEAQPSCHPFLMVDQPGSLKPV
ncbi:hypothetical protein NDU88_000953 [Pleurodeles waltl]|uniref:Uncharacterized protein n=1 Tax=Pleurodeles waltl TaxID=8319 RepID=A0AAV7TGZ4_PLEWA|nr:hypothetical protein NDU88_000953 [Pleurodeles waltl]